MPGSPIKLFLSGDVMLGRGVDQILPNPGDPSLREPVVADARTYVDLAEAANGPIPTPVAPGWPWGDLLPWLDTVSPDARIVNLETSITSDGDFEAGKGIHYRMHPANLDCLAAAKPDVVILANNHVLDFGRDGLIDTLNTLAWSGLVTAGAGENRDAAWLPARAGRLLVIGLATGSSGVPPAWSAAPDRPGVAWLPDIGPATADSVVNHVASVKQPGDIAVVSIHWGTNWGYDVEPDQTRFARRLVEGGIDLLHGHSSHHPRPIEVHHGKLILYGCGDLINDYEGISGHSRYRPDLRLAYLAGLDPDTGDLTTLRILPLLARRMTLKVASLDDSRWLATVLTRHAMGCAVSVGPGGLLSLVPSDR